MKRIKEKAKAYDKAINKAKSLYKAAEPMSGCNVLLETIFPELKESEDERIRKELISFFTERAKYTEDSTFNGLSSKEIIAWLEKQGEQSIKWHKNTEGNKPQKNHSVLIKTTHGIAEGEWNGGNHWIQYRWSGSIKDSDVLFWIELSDIEKQGEQKPVVDTKVIIPKFRVGDIVKSKSQPMLSPRKIISIGKDCYWCEDRGCIGFAWEDDCEIVEQKPADKVEPKFKIGQIIKKDGFNTGFTIAKIEDDFYYNDEGDYFPFTDQDNWQLVEQKSAWSEEDEEVINLTCSILYSNFNENENFDKNQMCIGEIIDKLKSLRPQSQWKPSDEHYELEEFAKIVRGNLTGISKAVQKLFEAKYLQLTGNKMYGGFKD